MDTTVKYQHPEDLDELPRPPDHGEEWWRTIEPLALGKLRRGVHVMGASGVACETL